MNEVNWTAVLVSAFVLVAFGVLLWVALYALVVLLEAVAAAVFGTSYGALL